MSAQSFELAVKRGPAPGTIFALADESLTIGRDPYADILINDPEVSRQHALLISAPSGDFLIQDLGSTNGTFVDGERLGSKPVTLRPSNTIALGGTATLLFRERSEDEPAVLGNSIKPDPPENPPAAQKEPEAIPEPESPMEGSKPSGEPLRQPTPISPEEILLPAQHEAEPSTELSPNLILGLVLLLLCCCLSVMVFLMYLGGDWFFRQLGLVP